MYKLIQIFFSYGWRFHCATPESPLYQPPFLWRTSWHRFGTCRYPTGNMAARIPCARARACIGGPNPSFGDTGFFTPLTLQSSHDVLLEEWLPSPTWYVHWWVSATGFRSSCHVIYQLDPSGCSVYFQAPAVTNKCFGSTTCMCWLILPYRNPVVTWLRTRRAAHDVKLPVAAHAAALWLLAELMILGSHVDG